MYLTIPQTVTLLQVDEKTVRRMIRDKLLLSAPIGGPRGTRVWLASLPMPTEKLREKLIEASLAGMPAAQKEVLLEVLQSSPKVKAKK